MPRIKHCNEFGKECKHMRFKAGISAELTKALNMAPHPFPTTTCTKHGVVRKRDSAYVKPLPVCRGKDYEPRELEPWEK